MADEPSTPKRRVADGVPPVKRQRARPRTPPPARPPRPPATLMSVLASRTQSGDPNGATEWVERASIRTIATQQRAIKSVQGARSTIAVTFRRSDGLLASTHGDHSIKLVDVDADRVQRTLAGCVFVLHVARQTHQPTFRHPRTPWTVVFHPFRDDIMASGCLGGVVRVWSLATGSSISAELPDHVISLAFHPAGDLLVIACGVFIFVWAFGSPAALPQLLIERTGRQRVVLFSPQCELITAEPMTPAREFLPENQSYMRVLAWPNLDHATMRAVADDVALDGDFAALPKTLAERVIVYSEGGIALSSCGMLLAFVHVPEGPRDVQRVIADARAREHVVDERVLAVFSLRTERIVHAAVLPDEYGIGITSVRFSPTDAFIVLGYGVRSRPLIAASQLQHTIVVLGFDVGRGFSYAGSLNTQGEDVNIALFHTVLGGGIVLGTRDGVIRVVGGFASQ